MPASSRSGVTFSGLSQLRRNIGALQEINDQALTAGEDAAAEVFKRALRAAAPRGEEGDLADSIVVYESRDRTALFRGAARRRLLVGPSKKAGFYGFFLEFGTSKMAARPWARGAVDAVMGEAQAAGIAAYRAYLEQHTRGMKV